MGTESGQQMDETTEAQRVILTAELQRHDAEIQELISALTRQLTMSMSTGLKEAQVKWEAYRASDAEFAALRYEGGTAAKLAKLARMVELSGYRAKDLKTALDQAISS